jgi:hypothetical protein
VAPIRSLCEVGFAVGMSDGIIQTGIKVRCGFCAKKIKAGT